jgi:RNA polymerase sigma-70 factor, ECF subfamily
MSSRVEGLNAAIFIPLVQRVKQAAVDVYRDVFEGHRHRIFSLAFYMTDNELAAEEVLTSVFCRVFAKTLKPDAETVDRALVTELRDMMPIGCMTLECDPAKTANQARTSARRADLEQAVVQLPATERLVFLMHDVEGYEHPRIARTIGITEAESRYGLFQARLQIRELLAQTAA